MSRKKPTGRSGHISAKQPTRIATAHPVRPKGPSTKTLIARQMYWAIQREGERQQADYQRQIDAQALGHLDLMPQPTGPTDVGPTRLEQPIQQGTASGSILTGGQALPTGFVPAPPAP